MDSSAPNPPATPGTLVVRAAEPWTALRVVAVDGARCTVENCDGAWRGRREDVPAAELRALDAGGGRRARRTPAVPAAPPPEASRAQKQAKKRAAPPAARAAAPPKKRAAPPAASAAAPPRKKRAAPAPAARAAAPPRKRAAAAPPAAKKRGRPKKAPVETPAPIWPSGSRWRPRDEVGSRRPAFHGCGKCRWRPSGCRGCIAADAERGPAPPPPPLPRGVVLALDAAYDKLLRGSEPDDARAALWAAQRTALDAAAEVAAAGVVDARGFGVVARRRLRAGDVLVDPTAVVVERPSDYARAHLGAYDYVAFGKGNYSQLREPALRHCSLTFFQNSASLCDPPRRPNVAWFVSRDLRHGPQLSWRLVADVEAGEELLAEYG